MSEATNKTTSRIYIVSASAKAFRAFKTHQTTGPLPTRGLVGIRGLNRNTGGSSGAGKSSVSHIISYVLGYSPYSATKQQSWLTEDHMQAELTLSTPEGPTVIRRGKETSIKVGEEPTISGSVRKVDERIEQLFGMPMELVSILTDRKQKKPGMFLSMDDKQKKAFLSKLLGLEELEKVIAKANETAKENFAAAEIHDAAAKALDSVLILPTPFEEATATHYIDGEIYLMCDVIDAIDKAKQRVVRLEKTEHEAQAAHGQYREQLRVESNAVKAEAEAQVKAFDENIRAIVNARAPRPHLNQPDENLDALRQAQEKCTVRIKDLKDEIEVGQIQIRSVIKDYRAMLAVAEMTISGEKSLKLNLSIKGKEIEGIRSSRCPTCTQQWVAEEGRLSRLETECAELNLKLAAVAHAKYDVASFQQKIADQETLLAAPQTGHLDDFRKALSKIEQLIATEEQKIREAGKLYDAEVSSETSKLSAQRSEIYSRLSREKADLFQRLQSQIDSDVANVRACENAHSSAKSNLSSLQFELHKFETEIAAEKKICANLEKTYTETKIKLAAATLQRDGFLAVAHAEQDFAVANKAFMGAIFDEVLIEIADEANDLLRGLPNVATTTISFISEKLTQKNEIKHEIKPVITKSGQIIDLEANLSGGQGTSVELATDLALGAVIGRRTGKRPGWMILDESFEGHDVPVKEACMEILRKASEQCAIYVVDHASEISELFDAFIDVESEDDVSVIIQRAA